jgi:soluble lytic murein transglycosylase
MKGRLRLALVSVGCFAALWGATTAGERASLARPSTVPDTALAELAVGRYWHAARLLRDAGAATGAPDEALLLATADAGWENWTGVLEVLGNAQWLDAQGADTASYLLARALERAERWSDAADRYERFAERAVGRPSAGPAIARRARALWKAGHAAEASQTLGLLVGAPDLRSWMAVELTFEAAGIGDTATVRSLAIHLVEPAARSTVWRAKADGYLVAGDSARAAAAFRELHATSQGSRRAESAVELGRLLLTDGDTTAARPLLLESLREGSQPVRALAAAGLIDMRLEEDGFDESMALDLARTVDRAGDGARALLAYDRAAAAARASGGALPEAARLERARLMATVQARQEEALEEFRALRDSTTDDRIGARTLEVWRQLRSSQRLPDQVATLRGWLLQDYPTSAEAVELLWSEGANADVNGRLDVALARYASVAANGGSSPRAGEARMRAGHIHVRRGNVREAANVFGAYLAEFPEGRRWQEAAYWAGRLLLQLGDSAQGREHLVRAMTEQPVEYYAHLAAELLDVPYSIDMPEGEGPSTPLWLADGLFRLDALIEAGLERGAVSEIGRLRARANGSRPAMLSLADALNERGRTIDGINIGWALLEDAGGWDRQILRVTFPFPYRELVKREAQEWGIDPNLLAAIIRQESAFKADVVSRAGAIGLMQVMPPTGAQLARAHGPRPFTDAALSRPEVNLHLGAAFFVDMRRRYDDLGLILSAYNAGPTRATRWREYPEASDPHRFTERIPIEETRGYVKSVRRNLGLYRVLYGEEE